MRRRYRCAGFEMGVPGCRNGRRSDVPNGCHWTWLPAYRAIINYRYSEDGGPHGHGAGGGDLAEKYVYQGNL